MFSSDLAFGKTGFIFLKPKQKSTDRISKIE